MKKITIRVNENIARDKSPQAKTEADVQRILALIPKINDPKEYAQLLIAVLAHQVPQKAQSLIAVLKDRAIASKVMKMFPAKKGVK